MLAQVIRNQDDELEIVNLAGAQSDGLPLGSIIPLHTTRVPAGFLPCNGTSFDRTQYPSLYTLLGTDVLPDLRELVLVGAGQNTTCAITAHDVYSVGQFKDDQLQDHNHNICAEGDGEYSRYTLINTDSAEIAAGSNCDYGRCNISIGSVINARTGSTTHGKQYGVFYVIKAVTGKIDIDDAAVYREIETLLESNYIDAPEKDTFTDGILLKYDKDNDKLVAVTAPVSNGQVMTSTVSTSTVHDYYYSLDGANYFRANLSVATPPATSPTSVSLITNGVVIFNNSWYYTDGNDWYTVIGFTLHAPVLATTVTDQTLIDELDAETTGTVSLYDWAETVPSVDYHWSDFALNGICATCGMYTSSVEACADSSGSSVEINAQDINVCGVLNACTCIVSPDASLTCVSTSCLDSTDADITNLATTTKSCTGWATSCTEVPNKGEIAGLMQNCCLACIWSSGNTLFICSL